MARWLLLGVLCAGCAVGRIRPDQVECLCIGHASCERFANGTVVIKGGALSNNLTETLSAALAALGAYFGIGAL